MEWGGERERSGVQSLPTAWLPISLQHGTYLSFASHSHERLTLRFVKKNCTKSEAQSILAQPRKPSTVWTPYVQPFTTTLHALSSYRQSFNTAQHIREEQNSTSSSSLPAVSITHRKPYSIVDVSALKASYSFALIPWRSSQEAHLLCLFMHFCWSKATAESNKGCLIAALEKLMLLLRTFLCHANIGKTQV